jgi:hypothetical protein
VALFVREPTHFGYGGELARFDNSQNVKMRVSGHVGQPRIPLHSGHPFRRNSPAFRSIPATLEPVKIPNPVMSVSAPQQTKRKDESGKLKRRDRDSEKCRARVRVTCWWRKIKLKAESSKSERRGRGPEKRRASRLESYDSNALRGKPDCRMIDCSVPIRIS